MKISVEWLSNYIETGLDAGQIAGILSNLGFPCEGVEQLADDVVIDIEVTSNRGDCLGYIGIGRELAAATGGELKIPQVKLEESNRAVTEFTKVEIAQPQLCGRYTARIIEGVKVGPSPEWMVRRLEATGLRSVNNVVDATNYAMMETSQPPHAFDFETLAEGKIIVRKAAGGERLISIDGSKCDLDKDMLIIADAAGPVAVAGIMGGLETEVSNKTTTILLEDAYFDPVSVRTTSRKLSLPSESSFRFERTVDIENVDWASRRTAQLITQVAGGKVAGGGVDIYPGKPAAKEVILRLSRLNKLLGIEVPTDEVFKILSNLGFSPRLNNRQVLCTVPSWRRRDVYREADLIEEVARVHGYNKIPTRRKISIEVVPVDRRQKLTELTGTYLNGCGFYETINVTFVDDSAAALFSAKQAGHWAVRDESGKGVNLLRQSLLGSLLGVVKTNFNAGNRPCRIFEMADTFVPGKKNALPVEKTKLALACDSDLRDIRGVIEGLIKNLDGNARVDFVSACLPWAQAGVEILVNSQAIGTAGTISEKVKENFALKDVTISCCELDFERLGRLQAGPTKVKPLPKYPAVVRDLSLILEEKVTWAQILEAVNAKAPQKLEKIHFVGAYRGEAIAAGKKSITLSLRFRDEDGTLTHEAVDGFEVEIVDNLTRSLGAVLRTL